MERRLVLETEDFHCLIRQGQFLVIIIGIEPLMVLCPILCGGLIYRGGKLVKEEVKSVHF
ncbi:MAG: hypothetical protein V3R57_05745 [Candidatus Bathyarchaeia archaeon]